MNISSSKIRTTLILDRWAQYEQKSNEKYNNRIFTYLNFCFWTGV